MRRRAAASEWIEHDATHGAPNLDDLGKQLQRLHAFKLGIRSDDGLEFLDTFAAPSALRRMPGTAAKVDQFIVLVYPEGYRNSA
jgi:hypothetical protein